MIGLPSISVYCTMELSDYVTSFLLTSYDIKLFIDGRPSKTHPLFDDVETTTVISHDNVNKYAILVLAHDIVEAIKTLLKHKCGQTIYFCCANDYIGRLYVFKYQNISEQIEKNVLFSAYEQQHVVHKYNGMFSPDFNIIESPNGDKLDQASRRIFNISLRSETGEQGGSLACLRNLRLANEEYRLITNLFSINKNEAHIPVAGLPQHSSLSIARLAGIPDTEWYKELLLRTPDLEFNEALVQWCYYLAAIEAIVEMDRRFVFKSDDVFLLQDSAAVSAFYSQLGTSYENVAYAYHTQGSEASERGLTKTPLGSFLERKQERHLEFCRNWIFPSKGSVSDFLSTGTDEMRREAENCQFHTAYNGYKPRLSIKPDAQFSELLNGIDKDKLVFVSTTYLFRNKGVERIPPILALVRKVTGKRIFWVLIGDGAMHNEVETAIKENLVNDEYIWFTTRFENQDNIFALFSVSDFYIMTHYVSVFDLAILQAMSYGCIPFLSDVGGNKELVAFENGILLDPNSENILNELEQSLRKIDLDNLDSIRERNKQIVRDKFNNYNFLLGYKKVLDAFS